MITATGLVKTFGTTRALDGVDVEIGQGEFVAIMGPSGSGKSTLLYALSGIDAPDAGVVRVDGAELTAMRPEESATFRLGTMGFVFQQPRLLSALNMLDNVVMPGFALGRHPRAEVVARARQLLEEADVAELADRDVTQASGGQLQRVAVARGLINAPRVLFCDEPTGALNTANAMRVLGLISGQAAAGTTVVMVTHDPAVAAAADRVVLLSDGRVVGDVHQSGDPEERRADLLGWLGAAV